MSAVAIERIPTLSVISAEQIDLLRRTVCKGASEEEMGQADNQSVVIPEPRVELPEIRQVAVSEAAQVYRQWRSPSDAILWAEQHLPHLSLSQIQAEFDALEVTHGKKAPAWVARVQELKQV